MRVFISVDMEGISGVVNWLQTEYGKEDYDRFRRLMTMEANAAIEGAFFAGAKEVLVNDSHSSMRNLIIEELNPDARLITGSRKRMSMMEGCDESFAAALFLGYHARASSTGVLNHTYATNVANLWVDGNLLGETGMNALVAGFYKVPVVLVTGDLAVTEEARCLLGDVETVTVKKARSRYSADCLHPVKARALIKESTQKALREIHRFSPLRPNSPSTFRLQFVSPSNADGASLMPRSVRLDPLTVEFTGDDYLEAFRGARAMIDLGRD